VRFLARQGSLPEAVHSCIGERDWPKLARHLVEIAQDTGGRPIALEHARLPNRVGIAETSRSITEMITSGAAPCVFLRGKTRHYTVISGYTPSSFKLFDSFGFHRVLRRSCSTTEAPGPRHRFHLRSIISLSAP
jgi:hypothetical protein